MRLFKTTTVAMFTAFLSLAAGCATTSDRPDAQLVRAEATIDAAQQSGANQYAADELDRATTKLTQAKLAADQREYVSAERLAKEAELNAKLAASTADRSKAEAALQEVNESIAALRREIDRNEMQ